MPYKSELKSYRIHTGFTRSPDVQVCNVALDAIDALTDHPVFTKLPVSLADLSAMQTAFSGTMVEARKGGKDRTRAKSAARQVLEDALIKIVLYVQGESRHNLDLMLSSGFVVVSTNRSPSPLAKPSILDILNNISGQLLVRGQGVLNGRVYQARMSADGGKTWTDMGNFNGARRMVLTPATPGTVYMVQFRALGGSTGQSDWSDPVSRMAT